jgi:hypothetical protein
MKGSSLLSLAILVPGLWLVLVSAEPPQTAPPCCTTGHWACPLLKGCPDDYCRKPMPAFPCLPCGELDDYCGKPCPRIWRIGHCGEPNDYDRKPCPPPCLPMCVSDYICVNACQSCRTPCEQQPLQGPSPSVRPEGNDRHFDQGGNEEFLPAAESATKGARLPTSYSPD